MIIVFGIVVGLSIGSFAYSMPIRNEGQGACRSLSLYLREYADHLGTNVYLRVLVSGKTKHFRIIPADWGHDFTVTTRVQNAVEAELIYKFLEAREYDSVVRFTPSDRIKNDMSLPLPRDEGNLELVAYIRTSKELNSFVSSLSGELVSPKELMPKSLDSIEAMRQWVFWNFYSYRQARTYEELQVLDSFRRAGFREIQGGLREKPGKIPSFILDKVTKIDRQFDRATLGRPITLFHVSANPQLEEVWQRLESKENIEYLPRNPAYIFTNMSKDFAIFWKNNQYKGNGIILEIQTKATDSAIPMDGLIESSDFLNSVSELEFILPRNSSFKLNSFRIDDKGNRILSCTLVKK